MLVNGVEWWCVFVFLSIGSDLSFVILVLRQTIVPFALSFVISYLQVKLIVLMNATKPWPERILLLAWNNLLVSKKFPPAKGESALELLANCCFFSFAHH